MELVRTTSPSTIGGKKHQQNKKSETTAIQNECSQQTVVPHIQHSTAN